MIYLLQKTLETENKRNQDIYLKMYEKWKSAAWIERQEQVYIFGWIPIFLFAVHYLFNRNVQQIFVKHDIYAFSRYLWIFLDRGINWKKSYWSQLSRIDSEAEANRGGVDTVANTS